MDSVRYFFGCIKPAYIIPDIEVKTINDIPLDHLVKCGIKGVIFDVDNTIATHNHVTVDERVKDTYDRMCKQFRTAIISNNKLHSAGEYESGFGTYIVRSKMSKPHHDPFYEAMNYMATLPKETVMIGDKLVTDIAGAKRVGIQTIKVEALGRYPILQLLLNGFEAALLKTYNILEEKKKKK
jgi:HAD superfamily phosphatase (TIGR01668 family)